VTEDHANLAASGGPNAPGNELPEENLTEIWPIPKRQKAKLDHRVTHTKHTTSHFLIDNFRVLYPPFSFPACSIQTPASRISNRHIPELESLVSHRKQRIGPRSNRHKFAFCNFAFLLHSLTFATRLRSEAAIRVGGSLMGQTSHCTRILRVRKCLDVRAGGQE
jgi:hypothetical protein